MGFLPKLMLLSFLKQEFSLRPFGYLGSVAVGEVGERHPVLHWREKAVFSKLERREIYDILMRRLGRMGAQISLIGIAICRQGERKTKPP